jgi:hypothetical protein
LCCHIFDQYKGENATPSPKSEGTKVGLVYLVPNPALQGYTDIHGYTSCATAISLPDGENTTLGANPAGIVAGLAYLVPNPALQG